MRVKLLKDWPRQRESLRVGAEIDLPQALARSLIRQRMAKAVKKKADDHRTSAAEAEADGAELAAVNAEANREKTAKGGKAKGGKAKGGGES